MICPCCLCDSLDHFTYQCPTIIEYMHRQMTLIQNPPITPLPVIPMITPTPSPYIVHIISPEPEALPTPPWSMYILYEYFPPNPPNSLVYFPMEILRPTTIFNPQYLDIWFTSSEPSQPNCTTPFTYFPHEEKHTVIVTNLPSPDPFYSCIFHCDEDILKELSTPIFPWNALHHKALFLS
jgi:hypothetical protein